MNRSPTRPSFCAFVALCAATLLSARLISAEVDTYVQATVGKDGRLQIVTLSGRIIRPVLRSARSSFGKQIAFDSVAISPDRRVVGWVARRVGDLPFELVLYSNGRTRTFDDMPVWRWAFEANGRQVAFEQGPLHGWLHGFYQLRDVATGRLIAEYKPPADPDAYEKVDPKDVPQWVTRLYSSSR